MHHMSTTDSHMYCRIVHFVFIDSAACVSSCMLCSASYFVSKYYHCLSLARSLTLLLITVASIYSLVSGQQDACKHYGKYNEEMYTHHAILSMLLQLTFYYSLE